MRAIGQGERRARLVARHHLGGTGPDVLAVTRDLVAVHSSDPITPYLALRARVAGFRIDDLDAALHADRTLWRLHAMRRTLFVVAADEAPVLRAACGRDVAAAERRKLEGWVAAALDGADPRPWLAGVERETVAALADGTPRATRELAGLVPDLALPLRLGSGRWVTEQALSSRLLFLLALEGRLVRGRQAGSWLSSQYQWAAPEAWFGPVAGAEEPPREEAQAALLRRYLARHGPATSTDVRWWTGWTVRATRAAMAAVAPVEVALDGGGTGWVLADDLEPVATSSEPAPVALLPGLDPTVMGWKERDWYLGDLASALFDRNGNAGPTVWVGGRIVGGWGQRPDGEVVTRLLVDVGASEPERVAAAAADLTAWSAGVAGSPRFRTPLAAELAAT
jgi:hypothetical protein